MFPHSLSSVVSNGLEVSLRVDDHKLPIYLSDGFYFVAGEPGKAYTIHVNPSATGRVEILTSVDGRNTLKDEPAAFANRGMIINRWNEYRCTGWRMDDNHTREFIFGDPSASIAAQATGSISGVGVIGVAMFTEKIKAYIYGGSTYNGTPKALYRGATGQSMGAQFSAADLGTEMGSEQVDRVGKTTFDRETSSPAAVIEIQYRTREWLVEHGVISPSAPYPSAFSDTSYGKYAK